MNSVPIRYRISAALTGALLTLAAPPINLYFLAWIGLLPLMHSIRQYPRNSFLLGFIAGFIFNTGILYWLALNTGTHWVVATISMIATVSILSIGWGFAAKIFGWLYYQIGLWAFLAMPLSWTVWEGILGHIGEISFPWPLLALTQNGFEPILQVMEFTGVWGVSLWVVAINVAIYFIWQNPTRISRRFGFIGLITLCLTPFFTQWHAYTHYNLKAPTACVMVVQGNINAEEKWILGSDYSYTIYDSLTRVGAESRVDLVVWPETAIPENLLYHTFTQENLNKLSDETNSAIITGASDYIRVDGRPRPLNAAFLILPQQGIVDRCAKRQLVPMGERVPFQWLIPSLGKLNFGQAEFLPGPEPIIFKVPLNGDTLKSPTLICYESAFPNLTVDFVRQGANFLITISNDAWYGKSSEPAQITALSRYRSIETRRAMARASNTGYSFLCDQLGKIVARTKLFTTEWAIAILPLCSEITFYVRFGDWLVLCSLIGYLAFLGWGLIKRFKSKYESK